MKPTRRFALALLAMSVAGQVLAADISGRVELFASGQPLRASESAEAVVYFRPRGGAKPTPATEPHVMVTKRKQFVPRVLPVAVGSTVRFPNEDPILHNAFSTAPDNTFDTGQYGQGPGAQHTFAQPGLVKVYCNVHHSMFGTILVLDTPHFTRPDATGRFVIPDVPADSGELVVYHDRAMPYREPLDTTSSTAEPREIAVRLDLNKRKVPPHMNKFGKPYRQASAANGY